MNEIERILAELEKGLYPHVFLFTEESELVRQALVKAAFAAIIDGNVAMSICSYVEASPGWGKQGDINVTQN